MSFVQETGDGCAGCGAGGGRGCCRCDACDLIRNKNSSVDVQIARGKA